MRDLASHARTLLQLQTDPRILVLANVWDVTSARVVATTAGTAALATASHAVAAAHGFEDGEQLPLELHLDVVRRISAAVELPLSVDMEAGYGDPGGTAAQVIAAGAVGGNLEDALRPLDDALAAVGEVLAAGRAAGVDFVLNARTDVVLLAPGDADRTALLEEAAHRGRAFLAAGAAAVFVPGVVAADEIAGLVGALGRGRLSVLAVPGATPPVAELERLGVARVSTGPFAQRAALTALQDVTAELLAGGVLPPGTRMLS